MNTKILLDAIENVEEIGAKTPYSNPPDILGVVAFHVLGLKPGSVSHIPWSRAWYLAELDSDDISFLIHASERVKGETPRQRRERMLRLVKKLDAIRWR